MPRTPGKANQVSTWFNGILRKTRQGDILENEASTAHWFVVYSSQDRVHVSTLI